MERILENLNMRTQEEIKRYYNEWLNLKLDKVITLYEYIKLREGN